MPPGRIQRILREFKEMPPDRIQPVAEQALMRTVIDVDAENDPFSWKQAYFDS